MKPPLLVVCVFALILPASAADKVPAAPAFERHVRPILKAYCFECHGEGEKLKGSLDLRLRRLLAEGGDSGPAIVPGKPGDSPLFVRVHEQEMPPGKKKLSADEVEVIRRWIAAGAKTEKPEPKTLAAGLVFTDDERNWWAFRPIERPKVPGRAANPIDAFLLAQLREKGFGFSPIADKRTLIRRATFDLTGLPPTPKEIDAFLADKSPNAYEKLIDRLLASPHYGERWGRHWLDVAGYADSEGFDQTDPVRATAWKYRDYVIRSYNADKPFDEFVREQLAGDEMVRRPYTNLPPEELDKLIATGFLRMAPDGSGNRGADQKAARNQVLADTVKIMSSSLLGLTVGCAQCHNHRYDPIPQADFYRLRAILEPAFDPKTWKPPAARRVALSSPADRKKAADLEAQAKKIDAARLKKQKEYIAATLEKEFAKLPEAIRAKARAAKTAKKPTAAQKKLLREHPSLNVSAGSLYLYDRKADVELKKMSAEAAAIRAKKPKEEFIRALTEEPGAAPPTYLFGRGDPDQPKEKLQPGALTILADRLPLKVSKPASLSTSGRRLAFADWVTDRRNPLFARVVVNRVWMNHFGRGIVGTPGDFGRLGERPTHPRLLDWLASEFRDTGYSMKRLHRLIMNSTAYRQSAARQPAKDAADPDNRLYGRFPVRRLDAEAVRDGMLAVSGKLNPKPFGPPVPVMEDDVGQVVLGMANRDGAGYKKGDESLSAQEMCRRSVYVQVRRTKPLAVLDTFDWATSEPNCEMRNSSTVTPQSLLLMNNEFVLKQAAAFAERLKEKAGTDAAKRVALAWQLAYGAEPTPAEVARATRFLTEQESLFRAAPPPKAAAPNAKAPSKVKAAKKPKAAPPPSPADRALAVFCQAVLMSNRFLYVD
jgi:hypothetical protein